ncbi:hypothetical protein TRFO_20375 [Tritrichomonas foetus]|uniref:Uncharacterized protein n=1 Tax=Tritrichomonas foetus TaxID=1144522 RepID=A0A1J4KM06_9EUKA|nr:hypothetical protein TRFO_20375 [Tritrichomonas foetus]|eukprot:OHT10405.1 hypothetical protein TRFO_20375 [Tritrichomonas foetus]
MNPLNPTPPIERVVHVYTLDKNLLYPKYQGQFELRGLVMSHPGKIAVPYSPKENPFPFLDVIPPDCNSFLLFGEDPIKDIHGIIWQQITIPSKRNQNTKQRADKDEYRYDQIVNVSKFRPYLFRLPVYFTKKKLFEIMNIVNENEYELWKIQDHQLYAQLSEYHGKDDKNYFMSVCMMKIIPYRCFNIEYHAQFSFFYIGLKSHHFIGSPIIFGLKKKEAINKLLRDFPEYCPKWALDYEIRFTMEVAKPDEQTTIIRNNKSYFNYDAHLFHTVTYLREPDEPILANSENPQTRNIVQIASIPYYKVIVNLIDRKE